jgi:hypothetical protein
VLTRRIREFMNREWRAVRAHKDAYWGQRIARLGPAEGFRIADDGGASLVLLEIP